MTLYKVSAICVKSKMAIAGHCFKIGIQFSQKLAILNFYGCMDRKPKMDKFQIGTYLLKYNTIEPFDSKFT